MRIRISTTLPQIGATYADDGVGKRLVSDLEMPPFGSGKQASRYAVPHRTARRSVPACFATSLSTGNTRTAIGRAPAAWNVEVAGVAASRTGELYHRALTASNGSAPVWQTVVTRRDSGTPTMTNNFWYAQANFSPTYDVDGNLTNDGRWTYLWNAENRLIQMETTSQATAAGHPYTKLVFVYDWMGRRIARHVWKGGTPASPTFANSTRWLYDGWNVITEFTTPSSSSTVLTRANTYTWGLDLSGSFQGAGGVGGLISQATVSSGVKERASYDGNGNIVSWTKSDQSAPTARREYDAFGNTLVSEGVTPCSFGFSTKMQDAETGLYYYGYRFYDAEHGRWLSKDPIEERGGVNLYAFVKNRPTYLVDLKGLCSITIDVGHGGYPNARSTERMNKRIEEGDHRLRCNKFISVGCGANKLNRGYQDAGIGVLDPPLNIHPYPDDSGPGHFEGNDICQGEELFGHLDQAISQAKKHVSAMCSEGCCCQQIAIKIECQDGVGNPGEMKRAEDFLMERDGRKPVCGTTIYMPCGE